jgi:hypothetical protein
MILISSVVVELDIYISMLTSVGLWFRESSGVKNYRLVPINTIYECKIFIADHKDGGTYDVPISIPSKDRVELE